MSKWRRRLKGLLGLGIIGGIGGAGVGVLWWVVTGFPGASRLVIGDLGVTTTVWAFLGAFAASGAGLLLTTLQSGRSLKELSPMWVGAFGMAMGLLAPSAFLVITTGRVWGTGLGVFAVASALVGGALGAGLVVAAKQAPPEQLGAGGADRLGSGQGLPD